VGATALPPALLKAPRVLKIAPVNRFQRPSIWSVESSESILKLPRGGSDFFARRRKVFDERAGGKRKDVRKL
jgi:hypothetical protein